MDKYKLYEKIKRTIKRRNRRPYPLFSKEEYINKYDWMLLNILFPGNDKNKLNISSVRIMQIKNGKYPNILRYINTRFSDNSIYKNSSKLLQENIYRILYHINVHPVCPVCHKFSPYRSVGKYSICCSIKCNNRYSINKEKRKTTCINKYGGNAPLCNPQVKDKVKKTCIEKYGVDNPSKYHDTIDKINLTNIKRYGGEWPLQGLTPINKMIETKRKNNTFNTSKPEEELYLYIKEKFPSVIRQYKDNTRYPFCCDFYIPELDYFIELNGTWTHGKHPYNKTNINDKEQLEIWESKGKEGHKYYLNAIKIWTIKDVEKRNCAKKHNLNFKEVWSLKEGKEFIDNLYEKREIP